MTSRPAGRAVQAVARTVALVLPVFVLLEVNYPRLSPQSELALFALFGLVLAFLEDSRLGGGGEDPGGAPSRPALRLLATAAAAATCLWVVVQTEPMSSAWWLDGRSLGDRAGAERFPDLVVGAAGLVLVLEATRRRVGRALPILALSFILYAVAGPWLPGWLLPHRGYGAGRIVSQTFLHSQGVFGVALHVMFAYVFLFVLFGVVLEATGATRFIVEASRRLFRGASGGPAKVAVLSSGLMGSLSGSAVANTATTGTFTIPMMRSAGFSPAVAAGLEAAASSGGALMPPVMGAGAYMMLEIIDPPVTYLEIIKAALLPAALYYLAIFLIVHFWARRLASRRAAAIQPASLQPEGEVSSPEPGAPRAPLPRYEGFLFVAALGSLVAFLLAGFSVFRAATLALGAVVVLSALQRRTRLSRRRLLRALQASSRAGVDLIAAAACVGIVIGVVTLTGIGTRLPALIIPLAQDNLLGALALIMLSTLVLGLGLPSAVCYLLMATLVGPVLGRLGVVPLAAHLFIFYFGMMSMVTPPVALAAYAASSIAGSRMLETSLIAFRFALVGFTLPYIFVYRPELLMLDAAGGPAAALEIAVAVGVAALGIVPLAGALAGHLRHPLGTGRRLALFLSAALALFPGGPAVFTGVDLKATDLAGIVLFLVVLALPGRDAQAPPTTAASS